MKFTNKILTAIAACALSAQTLMAGSLGFDAYAGFRTVLPTNAPILLTAAIAGASGSLTNPAVDTFNWIGDGKVDVYAYSNSLANVLTLAINGSTDCTNWTAITNLSLASAATLKVTNSYLLSAGSYYYNTNFYVTDNYLYPFTITTPNAFVAGFNTTYSNENPFTNGSPITLNGNGLTELGFHTFNIPRYLQFIYSATGTGVTNATAFSTVTVPVTNVQP